jgi:hypothetical protein
MTQKPTDPKTAPPLGTNADSSPSLTFNQVKERAAAIAAESNAKKHPGHDDWHVPTPAEGAVLVNFSGHDPIWPSYEEDERLPPRNKEDAASVQQKPPTSPKPKP